MDGKDLQAGKAVVHTVRGVLVPESAPIGDAVAPTDECVHVVKSGDTLDTIGRVRCAVRTVHAARAVIKGMRQRHGRRGMVWNPLGRQCVQPTALAGLPPPVHACHPMPAACHPMPTGWPPSTHLLQQYGTSVDELIALNNIKDPNFLQLGKGRSLAFRRQPPHLPPRQPLRLPARLLLARPALPGLCERCAAWPPHLGLPLAPPTTRKRGCASARIPMRRSA